MLRRVVQVFERVMYYLAMTWGYFLLNNINGGLCGSESSEETAFIVAREVMASCETTGESLD